MDELNSLKDRQKMSKDIQTRESEINGQYIPSISVKSRTNL